MIKHFVVAAKNLLILMLLTTLLACSDSNDTSTNDEDFSVEINETELNVFVGDTTTLSYAVVQSTEFELEVTATELPEHGTIAIDQLNNQITFQVGDQTGSGQFTIRFTSQSTSQQITINYQVNPIDDDTDTGSGDETCDETNTDCIDTDLNPYKVYFPSSYLTLFEDETIEIEIKRNYTDDDMVNEQFYFNSSLISGQLSSDENRLIIEALIGEEDTYGEIIAVTEKNGVINESKMYLIYYNKNRDLTTTSAPALAISETNIALTTGQSMTLNYEFYDPDSDRISYRVTEAPRWLSTHINMSTSGLELTMYPIDTFDPSDTTMVLELSDGLNVSQVNFNVTADDTEITDNAPNLYIEENVDVSLLVKLDGTETDLVTTLAFAANDDIDQNLEFSVTLSSDRFTSRINYPYVYIYSDDVSELNHDQITITASDGHYQSKLTYHLYVKDNFTEFLGGHQNSAPIITVDDSLELLETTGELLPFSISDLEMHNYTVTTEFDDSIVQVILENNNLAITALPNATDTDLTTTITLIATDEYLAQSSQDITITVTNNTPPEITYSQAVNLIEGATTEITFEVTDLEDGELPYSLDYDENKFAVVAEASSLFVTALNVLEDFDGTISIAATDSFGAETIVAIPAIIRYTNLAPIVTADSLQVSLLPGETMQMSLTYVDPDADEINIFSTVDNANLSYSYNPDTQMLTLAVSDQSDYEQNYTFSTSASDGFLTTFLTIDVVVPIVPTPPELVVSAYLTNVNEAASVIINYQVSDINGDNVAVTINNLFPNQLTLAQFDDYVEVTVPDNVLVDTLLSFEVTAQDDSANAFSVTETVSINVMPVNDPPEVTLTTNVLNLINDNITSLPITATDIDDQTLNVEVRTPSSAVVPDTLIVHGADINSIRISGASKGTIVDNQQLILRVSDGETYTEVPFSVSVALVNEPPVFDDRVDLIQLYENSRLTFNITPTDPDAATDGDVVSIVSVVSGDTSKLEIVGDPNNPSLNFVTFNTLDITEPAAVFIYVTATDGYEEVTKQIQVNIEEFP